jgi:hypothetical protein
MAPKNKVLEPRGLLRMQLMDKGRRVVWYMIFAVWLTRMPLTKYIAHCTVLHGFAHSDPPDKVDR